MLHTFELINLLVLKNDLNNFSLLFLDIGLPPWVVMFISFNDYDDYEYYEINGCDLNFDDGVRDDGYDGTSRYAEQCYEFMTKWNILTIDLAFLK